MTASNLLALITTKTGERDEKKRARQYLQSMLKEEEREATKAD
jgi:hypothetical protein